MKKVFNYLAITIILLCGIFCIQGKTNFASAYGYYGTTDVTYVKASHILVETKKEALEIKQQVEDGSITFEDAAKKYSKCPSGERGGDLGYFGRGQMVSEFEDAAFSLPKGQISQPIRTQFGWHLIKVTATR